MTNTTIREYGEKKLIKILLNKRDKHLPPTDKLLFESYRDDSALMENEDKYTVLSTDMLIEHSHMPSAMSYYNMGEKIVTVNVSDIISANAVAKSILISMALPPTMLIDEFEELIDGILDKCDEYDISLIGGDINENDEIILSGCATGQINKNVKHQNNIQAGNLIAVTGNLGSPAAGFDLLNNPQDNIDPDDKDEMIKSITSPTLPVETSKLFRKYHTIINAMTDITDGLAVELYNLKEKNDKIGFEIYYKKLPYNKSLEQVARYNNKKLLEYLLHFGEEFELLVILDEDKYNKYSKYFKNLHIIGKVTDSDNISIIMDDEEKTIPLRGYEHLKD